MRTRIVSLAAGAFLLTGLVMAQAPDQNQSQPGIAPPATQSDQQFAQSAPQQGQHPVDPAKAAKHLGRQLGLSQDQVSQIQPIIADRQQQVQTIRNDASLTPRDRRMKMHGVMEDSRNKIEALLTDSQKQQFEQIQANRREHKQAPQAQ
jgi:PBP1b-binding outer membrane lipoprotein LpoB